MAKHRLLIGTTMVAAAAVLPAGLAAADDDGKDEAYPPAAVVTTVPAAVVKPPIAVTGADGADTWLKVGAGAILVGGILVAATARRRQTATIPS